MGEWQQYNIMWVLMVTNLLVLMNRTYRPIKVDVTSGDYIKKRDYGTTSALTVQTVCTNLYIQ